MNDFILSPISLKDFETLIRDCVKSELKSHSPEHLPETEFITRNQAAAILGISLPTLNEWSKLGTIPSYRIQSRVRYKKAEVENSVSKVQSVKYRRG